MATNTKHDPTTQTGRDAMYKDLGRNLRRDDFSADDTGWKQWCDHRISKHTKEKATAEANLAYWTQVREGEHKVHAASVVSDLQKALAEVERLKAEVAKANNQQPKPKA